MLFKRLLFVPIGLLWLSMAWACHDYELTPPSKVKISGDSVMIIVHESSTYDARFSTKRGVDEAVRFAKARKIPVIYLQDDSPEDFYFMEDCAPDHWVYSAGGEIPFEVTADNLYIAGGHLELCMSHALHDIIYQWSKRQAKNHTITYFMDAIYSNGKMVEPSDPYYRNINRFMGVVTYGRPAGEHWPKLSMLETMGIIRKMEHQLHYLEKILPHWESTFSNAYQIEIQLDNAASKILHWGNGWFPPTVQFRFFDSALMLTEH